MGFLIALLVLLSPTLGWAEVAQEPLQVFYDKSSPVESVIVFGEEVLGVNDVHDHYRIHYVDPAGVVVEDLRSGDLIKFAEQGMADAKLLWKARNEFIVKQLKAVYRAQQKYFNFFKEGYAESLDTLAKFEYLGDSHDGWIKAGYEFAMIETGWTPKVSLEHENIPTFLASAYPSNPEEGDYFFVVDHLGQVRYGESETDSLYGPVWDYYHQEGLTSRDISLD